MRNLSENIDELVAKVQPYLAHQVADSVKGQYLHQNYDWRLFQFILAESGKYF